MAVSPSEMEARPAAGVAGLLADRSSAAAPGTGMDVTCQILLHQAHLGGCVAEADLGLSTACMAGARTTSEIGSDCGLRPADARGSNFSRRASAAAVFGPSGCSAAMAIFADGSSLCR